MTRNTLNHLTEAFDSTPPMPVLFLGHGSPMNAIEENDFVQGFREVSASIRKPQAVLCISAHWETRGTKVTAMEHPSTLHDFGGFPPALYEVQYPAPGSPKLARKTKDLVKSTEVQLDEKWGLDHGAWSVIKHMYPQADVPVIQMSLNVNLGPMDHYELGKELAALREKGVLIVGSGNMVHNLRMAAWNRLNESFAYDWAQEAMEGMHHYIRTGQHDRLMNYARQGQAFELSIPTPEHFLPLLYVLALQEKEEEISLFNDQALAGSISMTSVMIQ